MICVRRATARSRVARAVLGGLLTVILSGSVAWAAPAGFKTFTSASQHYRIAYPASWSVKSPSSAMTMFYVMGGGGYQTLVSVTAYHWGSALNTLGGLDGLAAQERQKQKQAGSTVSSMTKTRVTGVDAREWTGRKGHQRTAIVVFIAHGTLWELIFGSSGSAAAHALSQFKTMVASFAFTS